MTYNPQTPRGPDIPADDQDEFLSNFRLLNIFFGRDHIPFGNIIRTATLATPCVITSLNHRLSTGNSVTVTHMNGLNVNGVVIPWSINGSSFVVTVIDENTFSLNGSNTTAENTYIIESGDFTSPDINYGFHTRNFLNQPRTTAPVLASNKQSSFYSRNINNLAELIFKNANTTAREFQLTNIKTVPNFVENINGKGIRTPFGVIINFGLIPIANTSTVTTFPIPYTSTVFSLNLTPNIPGTEIPLITVVTTTNFTANYSLAVPARLSTFYIAIGK